MIYEPIDEAPRDVAGTGLGAPSPSDRGGTRVVVHYGEIGIKGKNRTFFLGMLKRVLQRTLEGAPPRGIKSLPGRFLIEFVQPLTAPEEAEVLSRIHGVFGVAHYATCGEVPRADLELLSRTALDLARTVSARHPEFHRFRVVTHRSDKRYPITSVEMNARLGKAIVEGTSLKVDLRHPEIEVHVEVLQDRFLVYGDRQEGLGGLPVGSSGRVVALLSSGIDSPVAAFRLMGRGCRLFFVHFHSLPYTHRASVDLAEELVRQLARHHPSSLLFLVPLAEIQRRIVTGAPARLRVILYRRYMLRLAEQVARKVRAKALVTGESLAQVASQTLDNLVAIEQAATMPILRPLIGTSKDEIIAEARALGTFDISIQPFDDCCSFLMPQSPETHAKLDEVLRAEERLGDMDSMIHDAIERTKEVRVKLPRLGAAVGPAV